MRVTVQDVKKVAQLARLSISEEETVQFQRQMEELLDYAEKINRLDTESVEPTYFVQHGTEKTREDLPAESLSQKEALANAPARTLGFFRVPKVIPQAPKKV